jgi:drug/metabolite transporter (DMT)-like permease
MTDAHLGLIAGLLAAMCSATTGLLVRGVGVQIPPISLNAWRCTVASLLFLPLWLVWNSAGLPSLTGIMWIALAVTCSIVIGDTTYFFAISKLGVAKATPIAKAYPIFAVIFSFFVFGESLGGIKIIGVVLAIVGTTLMCQRPKEEAGSAGLDSSSHRAEDHWLGVAAALGTAIAWALGAIVLKQSLTKADPITVSFIKTIIAGSALWAISSRVDHGRGRSIALNRRAVLLASATGGTLAGAALLSVYSIKYVGAGSASVYTGLAPLFAVPLGVIIFKEKMSVAAVLGCAFAIVGVYCVSLA